MVENWYAPYMQEMGIHAVYPGPNLSKRNFKESVVPYLLRNKVISFPNQAWSIDITYIRMQYSHMYLTAIIDWCSRKIMSWKLSDTLETAPVLEAVQEAVERFGVPAILKSDQGNQFTSVEYKALLQSLAIRQYVSDYNTLRPHQALDYQVPEDAYLACFAPPSAGLDRTPLAC